MRNAVGSALLHGHISVSLATNRTVVSCTSASHSVFVPGKEKQVSNELRKQYEAETGELAMYRKGSSDYHTLRYVEWLEARVVCPSNTAEKGLRDGIRDVLNDHFGGMLRGRFSDLDVETVFDKVAERIAALAAQPDRRELPTVEDANKLVQAVFDGYEIHVRDNDGFGETFEKWFKRWGVNHIRTAIESTPR